MLQKQSININFAQGLDTKTDPWQVPVGKFLNLENSIFLKGGLLQKRNGYQPLSQLPNPASYLTTFNGDLTAVGANLQALSAGYNQWVTRGQIQPLQIATLPLVRNSLNQTTVDAVISATQLVCTVYTEINNTTPSYKYVVADYATGQNIIAPTVLASADATYGTPKVFVLGNYFVILFTYVTGGTYYVRYKAISTSNPVNVTAETTISVAYTPATTMAFSAAVLNNRLWIAVNSASSGGIKVLYLDSNLNLGAVSTRDAAHTATMVRAAVDVVNQHVWFFYYSSSTKNGYAFMIDPAGNLQVNPVQVINNLTIDQMCGIANAGTLTILAEIDNNYTYDATIPTHYVQKITCTEASVVSSPSTIKRSIGLASKPWLYNNTIYFTGIYVSPYQSTYFVLDISGNIIARLAYQNSDGYFTKNLPSVTVNGTKASIGYLYKETIASVNKNIQIPAGSQVAGVYSQLGIKLATYEFAAQPYSVEIGANLNITGGYTYAYDGYSVTEQNFFLYPDSVKATLSTTGGSIHTNATYYYQVTYEWSDNQGNIFRSAPSIPVTVGPVGNTDTGSVTLHIPTLRLTSKTSTISTPVKICVYRWSNEQSTFYQTIANYLTAPTLNDTSVDYVTVVDTLANASIIGNPILYTTGGVVENIGPPGFSNVFLFDDRLWGITSEDPNLLWFSKQIIQNTPVEMSDLLTMFIPPSLGAQGPSGDLIAGFPMDDKAILFKKSSLSYFNGTGPDNTGSNSQYSPPILITSTLGCSNPRSIVFMPNGLMFEFQSEAGNQIWLLGRDLNTSYIGAPVESFTNGATVQAAVNVPGTNQVRFTMSSGITLVYDYYYQQWGTFTNIPATSSTLYQGLHTFVNSLNQVFQETPGQYLDGSAPVLMKFTTSWINLMGIQGYMRSFFFFLLGKYLSPHKIACQIAYDFNPSVEQISIITPNNFNPNYGNNAGNGQNLVYGQDSPYGGVSNVEQWRVFLTKQRCSAFQLTISELFDPSYQVTAGAGFTLSGLNLVVAAKKSFRTISAANSVGG